jgi:hypothetical protein
MKTAHPKSLLTLPLIGVLSILTCVAMAADRGPSKVVNGIAIYLGVLPSEMIQGHPKGHPEAEMHGGIPAGEHRYHILVALFDSSSGRRITDAEVTARVSELGLAGPQKKLEPMVIAGTITYGNYFNLPGWGPYRIRLQIRRPGVSRVIETELEYQHSRA